MYSAKAPVQKVPFPWYSLQKKSIERFFERIKNKDSPKTVKDLLSWKFPKFEWQYSVDGTLKRDQYLAAYIAIATHWCCDLNCTVAMKYLTDMEQTKKIIIGTILETITGNEDEINSTELNAIILKSGLCTR